MGEGAEGQLVFGKRVRAGVVSSRSMYCRLDEVVIVRLCVDVCALVMRIITRVMILWCAACTRDY